MHSSYRLLRSSHGRLLAGLRLVALACPSLIPFLCGAAELETPDELHRAISAARSLEIDSLGETPLRSVRFDAPLLVPNRDGTSFDVLLSYYRGYRGPAATMIVDLGTGKQSRADIPAGTNVHLMGHVIGPDGKLYWALQTTRGVVLWIYDPETNRLSPRQQLDALYYGQTNRLVVATDGAIIGTVGHRGERKAGVYEVDPKTAVVTDFGPHGPILKGSPYAMGLAADSRYAYLAYGRTPWRLIVFDRQERVARQLLELPAGSQLAVRQLKDGCIAIVSEGKRGERRRDYWLYEGRMIARESDTPPWNGSLEPRDQPGRDLARPLLDLADADPTLTEDGTATLRFRTAADQSWREVHWSPPTYAMPITILESLPDGRLLGGNRDRGGYFFFDPSTEQFTALGRIPLEHGATAWLDGRFYLAGYPGGMLYEFDPAEPWTATFAGSKLGKGIKSAGSSGAGRGAKRELLRQKRAAKKLGGAKAAAAAGDARRAAERFRGFVAEAKPDTNPNLIGQLRTASGMHRVFAAAVAADRRVYVGGAWYRDGKAGALAWFNPETRRVDGLWEPLATNRVVHLTAAANGKYIVVSTTLVSDVLTGKPVPETAKLFVFDTRRRQFVRQIAPPARCTSTGLVAAGTNNTVMGLMRDPTHEQAYLLYGVDVETGQTTYSRSLAAPPVGKAAGQPTLRSGFTPGPDARVWMVHEGGLLRIDPDNGNVQIVGRLVEHHAAYKANPSDYGHLAFSGDNLYLAGQENLRVIRQVLK